MTQTFASVADLADYLDEANGHNAGSGQWYARIGGLALQRVA